MRRIKWGEADASAILDALPFAGETIFMDAEEKVAPILDDVRNYGDIALCRYTKIYDFAELAPERIAVPEEEIREALAAQSPEVIEALTLAAGERRFCRR